MKNSLIFLLLLSVTPSIAQEIPRFKKFPILETGAQAYFPSEPTWEVSISTDSSKIYVAEVIHDNHNYGVIFVDLKESLGEDSTAWEDMITNYLGFLNTEVFKFNEVTPVAFGHVLESYPIAVGGIEYGKDDNLSEFKVKAWADSRHIAVMYVGNVRDMNLNFQELFLNGFRFP